MPPQESPQTPKPIDFKSLFRQAVRDTMHDIRDLIFARDTAFESHNSVTEKIDANSRFTPSFLALLVGASIVCTLGLLMNSAAIIIGGMIISPIMWPLMKVSLGVSFQKASYIRRALFLLAFSIILALFGSFLITLLSPLKALDAEILARTNPNLLDIIVALVAGFVAALGMIKPRISESLAGVAIATSLMPPVCVAGIGLALLNPGVFFAGLYLFLENAVTIVFVATIVFIYYSHITKQMTEFRRRGLIVLVVLMTMISIPSLVFLVRYSTEINTYANVESALTSEFAAISPDIQVSQTKTSLLADDSLSVTVTALVPQGIVVNQTDQQRLTADLEHLTGRPVKLTILIQETLAVQGQ